MEIKLHEIQVQDVYAGYMDSQENGVVGFGGQLNIRPAFQREFVYNEKQRNAVIETVMKGFPLNVMYWVEDENRTVENSTLGLLMGYEGKAYELLDGQQRTLSLCQYIHGDFSVNGRYFHNLGIFEKAEILAYPLMIYICKGNDKEKLDWFETINIAGVQLKKQELRNAIYTGEWLSDAKRYFSKNGCVAYKMASGYMSGEVNRQDYLETVLKWISHKEGISIEEYMARHQHDTHATPLWQYFQSVINWAQSIFFNYRKEMKGLDWGILYNEYSQNVYDPKDMEHRIYQLMRDDDVTKRSGIYEYLLSGNEKHLSIRAFTENQKRQVYENQNGICPMCEKEKRPKIKYDISEMEADHITPWCEGGQTHIYNCQMLCKEHNRRKSSK